MFIDRNRDKRLLRLPELINEIKKVAKLELSETHTILTVRNVEKWAPLTSLVST